MRLVLLLATMALHAFFGLAIISNTGLFLSDWYGAMGRTWGATPLADQQAAGGIAWSVGEIPTVSLAIIVAILWSRSDAREAKRRDRAADRDGDAGSRRTTRTSPKPPSARPAGTERAGRSESGVSAGRQITQRHDRGAASGSSSCCGAFRSVRRVPAISSTAAPTVEAKRSGVNRSVSP